MQQAKEYLSGSITDKNIASGYPITRSALDAGSQAELLWFLVICSHINKILPNEDLVQVFRVFISILLG